MRSLELVSSGMPWLDRELGGFPAQGVIAALGGHGCGKTTFGLGFALSVLDRGQRVCFITNDAPKATLELAKVIYERDLESHIEEKTLSILSFAPFFINKMKSLQSLEKPLGELGDFIVERKFDCVIFDTFDSMLGWAEGGDTKLIVSMVAESVRRWGVSLLCTFTGSVAGAGEFCHVADGSLELRADRMIVRNARWCNASDLEVSMQVVQGRGIVGSDPPARPDTSLRPRRATLPPAPHRDPSPRLDTSAKREGAADTVPPPRATEHTKDTVPPPPNERAVASRAAPTIPPPNHPPQQAAPATVPPPGDGAHDLEPLPFRAPSLSDIPRINSSHVRYPLPYGSVRPNTATTLPPVHEDDDDDARVDPRVRSSRDTVPPPHALVPAPGMYPPALEPRDRKPRR